MEVIKQRGRNSTSSEQAERTEKLTPTPTYSQLIERTEKLTATYSQQTERTEKHTPTYYPQTERTDKPTPPPPNFVVPDYKPEPTMMSRSSAREILTPSLTNSWSLDVFPWSNSIQQVNSRVFGNDSFKPCQKEIINAVLAGRNVFACMPTGAGKSLLYQLPALISTGVSLVVMPLLSLIKGQQDCLTDKGIRAMALLGTQTLGEQTQIVDLLRRDQLQILLVTPEKLQASEALKAVLIAKHREKKLDRLVIDEAHCISTWGTEFRAAYLYLAEVLTWFPRLPTLCLTSTAPDNVREDIIDRLQLRDPLCFMTSLNRPNLLYEVRKKSSSISDDVGKLIKQHFSVQSGIVYCLARNECDTLAKRLKRVFGISTAAYHAQLQDKERIRVQEAWLSGEVQVVVATIAFGLGINKSDVRFVIHTTFPKSITEYYQESGRAGRDGVLASCIIYYSHSDKARIDFLLQKSSKSDLSVVYSALSKVIAYCEDNAACRRQLLLAQFGESIVPTECAIMCDNCREKRPRKEEDVTEIASRIRRVVDNSSRLTLIQLVQFLTGKATRGTYKPDCGVFAKIPPLRLRRIINLMCGEEVLRHVPVSTVSLHFTVLVAGPRRVSEVGKFILWDRLAEGEKAEEDLVDLETEEQSQEVPPAGSLKRPAPAEDLQ